MSFVFYTTKMRHSSARERLPDQNTFFSLHVSQVEFIRRFEPTGALDSARRVFAIHGLRLRQA